MWNTVIHFLSIHQTNFHKRFSRFLERFFDILLSNSIIPWIDLIEPYSHARSRPSGQRTKKTLLQMLTGQCMPFSDMALPPYLWPSVRRRLRRSPGRCHWFWPNEDISSQWPSRLRLFCTYAINSSDGTSGCTFEKLTCINRSARTDLG